MRVSWGPWWRSAEKISVLDLVSRPEVFAALHAPLVEGYALDAIEHRAVRDLPEPEPTTETATGFTLLTSDCQPDHRRLGVGLGEELRFAEHGVCGTALLYEGELIQLSAFPRNGDGTGTQARARAGRVHRPSRRHRQT